VNGTWAGLVGGREDELVGRQFLDFVQPGAQAAANAMFDVLRAEAEVRSAAVVRRSDGSALPIELRAVWSGPDIKVCYRPLTS
jgi:hypothetical protein